MSGVGSTLKINLGVTLREYQQKVTQSLKRFNVLVWHRRAGKSYWAAWYIVRSLLILLTRNQHKNPQFAYVAPTKDQARRIIWEYLKDFTRNIPGTHYDEQKLIITINLPGRTPGKVYLLGVENYDSLRGMYFDGVVCDEYADWDPRAWTNVIRSTVVDRRGWVIFIGTSKGPNHFAELYEMSSVREGWLCKKLTVEDTSAIDPEELEDMKRTMSEEEFNQEMMCSFTGSTEQFYYASILEKMNQRGQLDVAPHVPVHDVFTFWDLGISDAMAIWFIQKIGTQFRVIDYEEWTGKGIPQVAKELKMKDYVYGLHILPHDGAARELGTGLSRQEVLEGLMGKGTVRVLDRAPIADGIDAVRNILPQCWFNFETTHNGIKALKGYQKEFDHKNKVYHKTPAHNWASHGSDGFRTFAMGVKHIEYYSSGNERGSKPTKANSDYDPFSF